MAFHDVRLPVDVERGAQGGPKFKTTILTLSSGYEQRNIDWGRVRAEWDIGYGIQSRSDLQAVIDFFYTRQGRAHSFRFKDWTDYTVGTDATNVFQEVALGTGAQTQFQIVRRYSSGGVDYDRAVTRPVSGTVRVALAGVEQFSGFSVDASTGVVTFTAAPGPGVSVGVICEFDVPVRFDTDKLDISAQLYDALSVPSIPVVEVRETLQVLS